jgi:signal transduction histidine kinase
MDSVVTVDPEAVTASALAPPIVIESVRADNRSVDLATTERLVEPSRLEFDYTSLSLRSPENARFRYRLDGYDRDWIEGGAQRHVTYGTLKPGAYRFRVIGAGSEGVWNDTGASLGFEIVPVFWRTWWFRLAVLAFALAMVAGLHRLRVRQLTKQFEIGVEARVRERTRIARELHDTLLQTFQGVVIHFQAATNLLPGRPDEAKHRFESVLDQAARAITEGREAVQDLRLSSAGSDDLAHAISMLGDELVEGADTPAVRVNVEGTPRPVRPILRDDIYRLASEAVRNAVRHAQARLIQVDIHYDDRDLRVRIRDDGRGIDAGVLGGRAAAGHWGLPGMRERADLIGATLEVRSRVGAGTEIDLRLPASRAYVTAPRRRRWWPRKTRSEART